MITQNELRQHQELAAQLVLITTKEPRNFKVALCNPIWCAAMIEELNALQQNNTWCLISSDQAL